MPSATDSTLAHRLSEAAAKVADRRRIGVVPLRGVIGGAVRSGDLVRLIDRVRDNGHIKAVVLDIHSPGGDAVASEAIYRAVRRLREKKPVVAWIRGTGASGAYFAACGATRMLAFPGAVIGSIGVMSARPVLVEALRRLGASMMVTTTGPFKDLGAPWREPTDEDREKERRLVDGVFRRFTAAVREARGFDDAWLARVATGEVWLADEAVELGLLDGVCDEEAALEEAQRLAELPRRAVVRLITRRTVLQRLGVPLAGLGPPGRRWVAEFEGWLRTPRVRLL